MLRLDKLGKRYGAHPVFDGLTYTFTPGCYALCEEDSMGKSTLLRLIAGELSPDSGDVIICGHSIKRSASLAKLQLAYVPDNCMALPEITGRELLNRVAQEKKTSVGDDAMRLASELGLEPHLDKRFDQMSTGTRRKVYLSAAAIASPPVIVADGPSDGLDSQARVALAAQFREWSQDRVILFATHDADLAEACGARLLRIEDLR